MIAAYTIMTLLVGFFGGIIFLASIFVYLDGRDEKRRAAAQAEQRKTNPTSWQARIDAEKDRLEMANAVGVVRDSGLAHDVITVEHH